MNDDPTQQTSAAQVERRHRELSALKTDLESGLTQLQAELSSALRRAQHLRSNDNQPQHER
jgi:hypothetical protein